MPPALTIVGVMVGRAFRKAYERLYAMEGLKVTVFSNLPSESGDELESEAHCFPDWNAAC